MVSDWFIITDFDGTLTMKDVSEQILIEFAQGDWKGVEELAVDGKITMDECMQQQYEMIRGDHNEIMRTTRSIPTRPHVDQFLQFVNDRNIPVLCVSAGLSFTIDDFIKRHKWNLKYIAPKARLEQNQVNLELVKFDDQNYRDFKEHYVKENKKDGKRIIYFGDGTSDYEGSKYADIRFSVRNSSLSRILEEQDLQYYEFDDFQEVIEILETKILG